MKIAIHATKGFFSDRWIAYCEANDIDYKPVNCYSSDVMCQLSDCDCLMWHFNHKSPKASKFAKQLLFAVQASGKRVFPDFNTVWHFDDKVGQKYLLEAVGAPLAPAYVFYNKLEALTWAKQTTYPKVFKLRNGAGSDNVLLVKSKKKANRLINKSFRRGFKQYQAWSNLKERFRKYRLGKTDTLDVLKGIMRLAHTTEYSKVTGREIGYIYFQDFIPGNDHDIRVVVIGEKAFAIKRMVRKNDFRASGSGSILYEKENFDVETVRIAFEVSEKLHFQCMAYDFVYLENKPLIVEISYGFAPGGYDSCTGYWDKHLNWHDGKFNPYGWMVEDLINNVKQKA
jgi:glutathione synthase/RimK-type ligase-like ATP-grasp enzyme